MNTNLPIRTTLSILAALVLISLTSYGQNTYTQSTSRISIAGTSTMHDWTMKSESAACDAILSLRSRTPEVRSLQEWHATIADVAPNAARAVEAPATAR